MKLKNTESHPLDSPLKSIGIALAVFAMVLTVDWTVRQLWHPPAPFAFPMPTDACIIQWKPLVLMQNTATRTQTYLRTDGARVTVVYAYDMFTGAVMERGRETWFDGECSMTAVKGRG
jgi:hypothetical protein